MSIESWECPKCGEEVGHSLTCWYCGTSRDESTERSADETSHAIDEMVGPEKIASVNLRLQKEPKRRWLQFSLRTLLIVVTVLCVWLAITAKRARDQRQAVESIRELGGIVRYEHEIVQLKLNPPGPKWLRRLIGDEYFFSVNVVWFTGSKVNNASLEVIKRLTDLNQLVLKNTKVADAGLVHVQGLTDLRLLDLSDTQVADAGLEHLKGLTNLQRLYLNNTHITDTGLEHLKELPKLLFLSLRNTQITDAGLEHLKGLAKFQWLDLSDTQVTDAGVKKLEEALPNCKITR